jgi:hypothetical protein
MKSILTSVMLILHCAIGLASEPALEYLGQRIPPRNIPLKWQASLGSLPASGTVYQVVSGSFEPAIISNMLSVAGFTENDRTKCTEGFAEGKKSLCFQNREQTRYLSFVPSDGRILFGHERAVVRERQRLEGVPSDEEALRLAEAILPKLGIDGRELARQKGKDKLRCTGAVRRWSYFDKTQGKLVTVVIAREVFLIRSFGGIPSVGMGGGGGIWFTFGNHGQLAELDLAWRAVKPKAIYPVATRDQFLKCLQDGKCVYNSPESLDIKGLVITEIAPYYLEAPSGEPQVEIHPIAEIEAEAQLTSTNLPVRLYCPLLVYQ